MLCVRVENLRSSVARGVYIQTPPFDCPAILFRSVLFCSLTVIDLTVGHTMDVLSPFISVLRHSD